MKKTLALVLAGVMAAGMTTVAFAEDIEVSFASSPENVQHYVVDANDDGEFDLGDTDELDATTAEGGKKVALLLYQNATTNYITDNEDVKRYRISDDWDVGDTEKPVLERIKIVNGDDSIDYVYALTFTLPDAPETKDADLIGDVTFYRTSDQRDSANNTFHFAITYGVDAMDFDDAQDVDFNKGPVKFENDGEKMEGEEALTFGEEFEFEVDVTGQGKLNLAWNTDFNKEFAAMYDYANIDFITFEYTPSFNKTGRAYIYASEDAFIYEVTADGAKAIKGLEWDEDYEAWTFRTRTLGAYAISDVELDEKTVTEDKDDTTEDGNKQNPDTGR